LPKMLLIRAGIAPSGVNFRGSFVAPYFGDYEERDDW
jgi:hypothetical protein